MPINTERLLLTELPNLVVAAREDPRNAFKEWQRAAFEAAGAPGEQSKLSWDAVYDIVNNVNRGDGRPQRSNRAAAAAMQTAVRTKHGLVRLHRPNGVFLTADAQGSPIAAYNHPDARLAAEYGSADPYILNKLGGAIAVEGLVHQGADWGDGYEAWRELTEKAQPTIGMATLHGIAYDPETNRGQDRNPLAFTGASHRIATGEFLALVADDKGFAALPRPDYPDDFLAGMLDSASAAVANRAAILGLADAYIIGMPNPTDSDNLGVNWN